MSTALARSSRRIVARPRFAAALAVVVVAGGVLMPAASSADTGHVPGPAVAVDPQPAGGVSAVFGTNAAGDTFYNQNTSGFPGAVLHSNGSITPLAQPLAGDGAFGPDGRLWLPLHGSLWAVAGDGTMTEYPVVAPQASATTGISVVRAGVDGKVWFLDHTRSSLGSIDADGTDLTVFPVAGERTLQRLSAGTDGRMWVTRGTGQIQAVTPAGVVSTYGKVGYPVGGLASNPSGLYLTVGGALRRVAADGSVSTVDLPGNDEIGAGGEAVASHGWLWFGNSTAVSPSGRIVVFSMPVEWSYRDVDPVTDFGITEAQLATDETGGFVGHVAGKLTRIADPALSENVLIDAFEVRRPGTNVLRLVASDRTPGGAARSGTYEIRVGWDRYIPDGLTVIEVQSEVVGTITLNGSGSIDIPIVPSMVRLLPQPYTLDHGHCCTVYLRKVGVAPGAELNSRSVFYRADAGDGFDTSQFQLSKEMKWLDAMDLEALGRPIDDPGARYWAPKLANGTSRTAVVAAFVDTTTWRRHRVVQAYARYLRRTPDAGGLDYWANWLKTHTTAQLDEQIGGTVAARDAEGTTNVERGKHLAAALRLGSASAKTYTQQLDAGTRWTTVLHQAYWSRSAVEQRMKDLGSLGRYNAPLAQLVAQYRATGDDRRPLATDMAAIEVTGP